MDIRSPKQLKQAAARQLGSAPGNPHTLVLLHTAVSLGIGLLVTVLDFILTRSIDATGGLPGLQLRSFLSTAQSVLQMASSLLLPFWQVGILAAALAFARQEAAAPDILLSGFRQFRPVLRLLLLRAILLFALAMGSAYIGTFLFMMTPLSRPVTELITPLVSETSMLSDPAVLLEQVDMDTLTQAILPVFPIYLIVFGLLALPMLYRLSFAEYCILDGSTQSGLKAFSISRKLTKGHVFHLLKIDLSFWWFWLLQALCAGVAFADLLLPALGIQLPLSNDSAFFVFYILSRFLQLALYRFAGAQVYTTRAMAYETLRAKTQTPAPIPENIPWDY